jgi:aminopeptidase N
MLLRTLYFIFLSAHLTYADQYPRNESIDIIQYKFSLVLNDSTDILSAEAQINMLVRKPFTTFELDLVNQANSRHGMSVSAVTRNGQLLAHVHQQNRLKIMLPTETRSDELLTIMVSYSGIPADGLIISKNKYGDRTFFGDNWPDRARHWLPTIDHPYDKAAVEFIVTAPLHYSVIANGIKKEEYFLNARQKLTHWQEENNIPTKVMVIGVARFAIQHAGEVGCIPIESWVYPQNRKAGYVDYAPAVEIFQFFQQHIGPYSYKKLANVQSTTRYGGMENASNIFYYENSVTGKNEIDDLIAHEVAHQWFGNSASEADWHHVWLSEGFATYFTHVYNEFTHGHEQARQDLSIDRRQVIDYIKSNPAPVINTAETDYSKLLTPHVYQRGGWVLHMLRNEIGDDAFWKGIREYYIAYQNSNALTADLQRIMEKHAGKSLDMFVEQWLYRSEIPVLRQSWTYENKTGALTITIEQAQRSAIFDFPLEIGIALYGSSEQTIESVRISQKTHKIQIKPGNKPDFVVLDPNVKLLFVDISRK